MRQANATRPRLQAVNKVKAIRRIQAGGIACVTMSPGQWDQTLAAAYRGGLAVAGDRRRWPAGGSVSTAHC